MTILSPSLTSLPMESRDAAVGAFASVEILPPQIIGYEIIDGQTQQVVGRAKIRSRAHASADRRDNAYGAIRYRVRPIYWTARD